MNFPTNPLTIDIETSGLSWHDRILAIGVAWVGEGGRAMSDSINVGMRDLFTAPATIPEARAWLQSHLEGKDAVVLHNGSFDIPFLMRSGLIDRNQLEGRIFDTLVMARCTAPHASVSLEGLCREYELEAPTSWSSIKRTRSNLDEAAPEHVQRYAAADAAMTLKLYQEIAPLAHDQYDEEWIKEEGDFVLLMSEIRMRGIPLDVDRISRLIEDREKKDMAILKYLSGLRIEGPYDRTRLPAYLIKRGYPVPQTAKGNPSLDEAAMKMLLGAAINGGNVEDRRLINAVLKGRHWQKELSTWLRGFLEEADDVGRVHPSFSVGGTMSYRLSCSNPNAQAVPAYLGIFHPDLVEADYEQAELRVAAMYAGEDGFARIFSEDGHDLHGGAAKLMYGDSYDRAKHRRFGKAANFSTIYGGGKYALAESCGIPENDALRIIRRHKATFPAFPKALKQAERVWQDRGYLVLTHGKRIWASEEDLHRSYKAFNNVIQGSVAEIIKRAMMEIASHVEGVEIVNQVHDSLVLEADPEADRGAVMTEVVEIMKDSVPAELRTRTNPRIDMEVSIK